MGIEGSKTSFEWYLRFRSDTRAGPEVSLPGAQNLVH